MTNDTRIFIAKPDTWYKEGTLCKFLGEVTDDQGIFLGLRVVEEQYEVNAGYKMGEERMDEEVCGYDEFYIIDIAEYLKENGYG